MLNPNVDTRFSAMAAAQPSFFSLIESNAEKIVSAIGKESVEVYRFLREDFERGPITDNCIFQFLFRSFYRLDNAGLTPEFKSKYFALLEDSRHLSEIDLRGLVSELYAIPNVKGQQSLQFSFVTKLANTVNHLYPIYDSEVGKVFHFSAPSNYKTLTVRLDEYMRFYSVLRETYSVILAKDLLRRPRQLFRQTYKASPDRVPDTKALDFIFWSAGKLDFVLQASDCCSK